MSEKSKFYLTTPIYYVNARPHIGHAYSTIVADVLARRHRLLGDETYFLTGTDEHGQKIERSAAAAGIPPQQFADGVSKTFSDLWKRMGITHDQFIRTTDEKHKIGVQKLFRTLYENGFIELKSYVGSYCVSDEAFVDAPVGTPCPDCGRLLEEVTEENFFFKLSAFQRPLLEAILSESIVITPLSAKNEIVSFLAGNVSQVIAEYITMQDGDEPLDVDFGAVKKAFEAGILERVEAKTPNSLLKAYFVPGALKDLSISRSSFTWGIPVPEDIQKAAGTQQNHVIYVWLDALANYMTALGYGSEDDSLWRRFWPADLHLVGKEITRFHCVYWPAFLMAAGLPLPKQVTANGWLLFDNSKMSKSKGNVVRTETILDAFGTLCPPPVADATSVPQRLKPQGDGGGGDGTAEAVPLTSAHDRDLFAADVLRYYLLREIPFGQDGSFSFDSLVTRYNADLANGYGNLVSRTARMIQTSFGEIPTEDLIAEEPTEDWSEEIVRLAQWANSIAGDFNPTASGIFLPIQEAFDNIAPNDALWLIISQVGRVDLFLSETEPWRIAKRTDADAKRILQTILYTAAESIRIITALLYPILPYATARVWQQLGLGDIEVAAKNGELTNLQWGGLKPGTRLGPLGPIFPRAPKELAQTMADNEESLATSGNKQTQIPSGNDKQIGQDKQEGQEESTHPGAPPRTSSLPEPSGTLTVGGSAAHSTGPDGTPSHTEAQASGIFASPAAQEPAVPQTAVAAPETAPQIGIEDFAKIELRVAQITLAERIPKADKLLRLEVDLGPHGTRQILSGIAEFYTPEELTGRRIVVITNLAPRKMRGLESHGMLLAASDGDHGKPYLATCGDEIALGSRLK
jgi:methionyl-tRNA synthetase